MVKIPIGERKMKAMIMNTEVAMHERAALHKDKR